MYLIVLNIELVDEALQEPVFVNVLPPSEANGAVPPMTRLTLYDVLTSDMPSFIFFFQHCRSILACCCSCISCLSAHS